MDQRDVPMDLYFGEVDIRGSDGLERRSDNIAFCHLFAGGVDENEIVGKDAVPGGAIFRHIVMDKVNIQLFDGGNVVGLTHRSEGPREKGKKKKTVHRRLFS
jgi:hypothetical protein